MVKKPNKNSANKHHINHKIKLVLIVLLTISVSVFINLIITVQLLNSYTKPLADNDFMQIIGRALDDLNDDALVDPETNEQFIPDIRMKFPYDKDTALEYRETMKGDEGVAVSVTGVDLFKFEISNILGNSSAGFSAYNDRAQKCSSAFHIVNKNITEYYADDLEYIADIEGGEGKVYELYRVKDACNYSTPEGLLNIENVLLSAQPY